MNSGAWFVSYEKGAAGTLGESLLLETDNLGWAIRSWKYELAFRGFRGGMVLDSPVFGDAMRSQVRVFQEWAGIGVDGIIGPVTGKELLNARLFATEAAYGLRHGDVWAIVAHESAFDVGAVGSADHNDRGCTQQHVYTPGSVNLSQAIRPALAVPRLAAQLRRLGGQWDRESAIASWNIGEGGAEWWHMNGKPTSGSPSWWAGADDMSARATSYVAAINRLVATA